MSSNSVNLLALPPRKKNPAKPPRNRDNEKLLTRLKQSALTNGIDLEPEIRLQPSKPRELPPNPRTSESASFLSLPRELRHRILFQSAKCDWLRLLHGDMFTFGKVHPSYLKWLPECFREWARLMRRVDHAGRLEKDVDFVVETWWKALNEMIEEREAREKMGGMSDIKR